MTLREFLRESSSVESPAYYFDLDVFEKRVGLVKDELQDIPLTFSIKANPFLLFGLPDNLRHVEVCSPGELQICKHYGIPGNRIIYSGVNKENTDVTEAISYGVDIATAESKLHIELEQAVAASLHKKQSVIFRLTSGNQFGMSEDDIFSILSNKNAYPNLDFIGIHYYSGTQKKLRQIEKDLKKLDTFLKKASDEYGFVPQLVEMGPGLAVEYFEVPYDEEDEKRLREAAPLLLEFANKYPLGVEMGRFLAAPCGTYVTKVVDIKNSSDTNYLICDGGIHHLKYYGQTMAMQVPEMEVLVAEDTPKNPYCICGSLCTVADVLVREVNLPEMTGGDQILFHRCGAYSVTEGSALFLSRQIPAVYVYNEEVGLMKVRSMVDAALINRENGIYVHTSDKKSEGVNNLMSLK